MQSCKVEICGVNTSRLTVMKESEKMRLIALAQKGDAAARDALVAGNLRLVLSIIQRFLNRGELPDDLFQVGCIGLLKAIDNFDLAHGVRFSTYAVPMIIGEVRRYLRDNNAVRVSRSLRDTAYRAMQTKEQLQNQNNAEPSIGQIAAAMHIDAGEVVAALESVVDPISLYDPLYSDSGDPAYVFDQLSGGSGEEDWLCEISFRQVIDALPEREKRILTLRFIAGRTQMEVAAAIGISQAQVSRLEKNALTKIKQTI
ncbi:MAG: RNA polymerase sporulation sigma factor SigG [Oscillospiraceae bacterium]|nr:RNA polymerase sporulation sigma factor SigG [Oscillospiraceae bacterium]